MTDLPTRVTRLNPMFAVSDMEETIAFYRVVLGFAPTLRSPEISIIERDGQSIILTKAESERVMRNLRGHTEFYIHVTGIEALWEHVKEFKDTYRIKDLFDREYGMREFHIVDPNGCLVFIGEPISK